jgi:hypothetical protein
VRRTTAACRVCALFLPCLCAAQTTATSRMCALSIGFPLPVKQEVQHAADVIPRTRGAPTTLPSRGGQIDRPAPLQRCDQGLREVVREILLLSTLCPVPPGVRCVARLLESSRPTSPERVGAWGRVYGLRPCFSVCYCNNPMCVSLRGPRVGVL